MKIEPDRVGLAFVDAWECLLGSSPGWWVERRSGVVGGMTYIPLPGFNGAWAYDPGADVEEIGGLLDRVADAGGPYCLQACSEIPGVADLAGRHGMSAGAAAPLMVLAGEPDSSADPPPGLVIRELAVSDRLEHVALAAAGFEVGEEYFRDLVTPELAGLSESHLYVGEVDGEPVTTSIGLSQGEAVGVVNVATPPEHRGRGYGAAVTMHAVRAGLAEGAGWAWLQASPAGFPVYDRLGFRTVATWRCWTRS